MGRGDKTGGGRETSRETESRPISQKRGGREGREMVNNSRGT